MIVRRSVVRTVLAILGTALAVAAQFVPQNARINGLAGTFIMDDMNDVLRYSAYLDQYKDGAQATYNGPIMGIKSIGDVFSVGVVANRGLMLDQSATYGFYTMGSQALAGGVPATGSLAAQNVPHLLFGMNLSVVSIGIDAFYEYASASIHNEAPTDPPIVSDAHIRIHNPGAVASVLLGGEDIPTTIKIGFGVPSVRGKSDDGTTEVEVSSDKGSFFTVGGEVGLPVSDLRLTLGLDWNFEGYAFSLDDATPAREYHNSRLANYIGLQGDLFTDAKWGAQYAMYVLNATSVTPADTTTSRQLYQVLSCGIENSWRSVWIFDEAFVRGGVNFSMFTPIAYSRNATTTDSRTRGQTTYNPVAPSVGAGVKKSAFQLDVTINPTQWTGLVAGPAVGTVTLTVMF